MKAENLTTAVVARVRRADGELVSGSAGTEGSVGYLLDSAKPVARQEMKAEIY
jgi:hypothetical protein